MSTDPEFYRRTLHPTAAAVTPGKVSQPKGEKTKGEGFTLRAKCQFQDITEHHSCGTQNREVYLTSQISPQSGRARKKDAFKEYAVVLRRIIDLDNEQRPPVIRFEIQSESLRREFRSLVTDSAAGDVDLEADPITISPPFQLLFHSRDKINGYTSESPELVKEMKLVAQFLAKNEVLLETQIGYDQLWPRKKISFQLLWTIYRPGELVVLNIRGITECWEFQRTYIYTDQDGIQYWTVCGRGIEYDGTRLGLTQKSLSIPMFPGTLDIMSLPVIPLEVYPDDDRKELMRKMIIRGKRFEQLIVAQHCSYNGLVWTPDPEARFKIDEPPGLQINGRVIVDYASYLDQYQYHCPNLYPEKIEPTDMGPATVFVILDDTASSSSPTSEISSTHTQICSSAEEIIVKDNKTLTDDKYLLCPARIPGFSLSSKVWGYFSIEGLSEVQWRQEAFDMLEMDKRKKDLVRSLIQGHNHDEAEGNVTFKDIIKGKGNGLIFMLHGPPGLGKTLMAESISENSKRPLYQISSGELTNDVKKMEKQIRRIFEHGKKWNAIVLLDEADVLMASRDDGDLASNAIVSVFLRLLEYYEGILFLTTNRPTNFDEAILNRVHLSLAFEPLTPTVRQKIWKNILKQNLRSPSELPESWTEKAFEILGNFDINGRSIKNLLRTASCYANSEGRPLGLEHLNEVMQVNLTSDEEKAEKFSKNLDDLEKLVESLIVR